MQYADFRGFLLNLRICGIRILQICQSIYDNKMPIEKVSIDHMMKQLGEVLNCTNKEDLTKLEDAVIIGLEGFRFYEMWTSEKYR